MNSDDVARMNLLATLANLQVNIEILEVSKALLKVNAEHLTLFKDYKEFVEDARNIQQHT